ncbi:AAA family ATPase [Baekduia sp. Peel2402]|uniref:AAA family ATPase n=1 Tax=Baekduia sp. Peel2402 TaxID=3458296 RepID=UPI00403EDD6E
MIRIARLDLERWGHFEGRSLAFGAAGALHVVYGPNEAGKSTTRRAVGALLFGVPERTGDTYGRPGADLRIGARLELGSELGSLEVVRRKGRKDTLLDAGGEVLDPAPLEAALGGLTREVHENLFEITHESLVEGGLDLLAGRGAVGESLFAAAAGTSRLHGLMRTLESDADDLFSTRPSKKSLNVLLARHAEILKVLRDASLRPPQWEQLSRELAELEKAYDSAGAALLEADRERSRLQRLQGVLPLAAQRTTAARALEALGSLPALAADASARRVGATERRREARSRASAAERDLERRRARLADLTVDDALLPAADDIEHLHERASAVAQDDARRTELLTQAGPLEVRLGELLSSLNGALGADGAEPPTLDDASRARLESCLQERAGVEQAARSAVEALEDARRAAARAADAAERVGAVADDAPLAAAIRAARAAGSLDESVGRAMADERAALDEADALCARMNPPVRDAETLRRLPVPDRERIATLLESLLDAQSAAEHLATEASAIADRVAVLHRDRDRLTTDAPLLSRTALTEARTTRAALWSQLRAALTTGNAADPAPFEQAVQHADTIADTRLQHASALARLATIDDELQTLARDADELAHRRTRHAATLTEAEAAWTSAWPEAFAIPSPAQAGAWLAARDAVLAQLTLATAAAREAALVSELRERHAVAIRAALGEQAQADMPLLALVELADARLETLREQAERAARLADDAARTAADQEDAEASARRARTRQDEWRAQWSALRDACGLAASLDPDDALAALRALDQVARDRAQLDALRGDVASIEARRGAFEQALAELIARVAPELGDEAPLAVAGTLHRRAAAARAAAAEREALAAAVAELEAEQADAIAIADEADAELAALREAAGAEDDEALVRRERDVARAEELRAELQRLDADLARAGGAPADEVLAAVAALDADALPARLDALEAGAAQHRDERDAINKRLTLARDELGRLERSDEAARARQEATVLEAEIQATAERYARARLAQRVLRDAIARFRSAHEGPLLARANQLFPALTCERFARLETDLDEKDRDILVAITADGARLRVDQLSDGTREQLFLALRLAALERHAATAQPVPVLFDDVLLESDDARAERILAALADLAALTQVIVLTHHRHLVDIAAAAVGDRLDVIALAEGGDDLAPRPRTTPAITTTTTTAPPVKRRQRVTANVGAPQDDGVEDEDGVAATASPTLAEELTAAVGGGGPPRVTESPYGEQTTFL